MRLLLLCASILLALVTSTAGQATPTQTNALRALPQGATPTAIEYKIGEGYTAQVGAQRSGPETIFNTRAAQTYYFWTNLLSTDEFVDEGSLHFSGLSQSEQVNGVTFDYCSLLPDPAGNAITVEMRFYAQLIAFQGVVGWVDANNRNEQCGYLLTGLPGNSSGALVDCWTVHVDLTGGFECSLPQEQSPGSADTFGWSTIYSSAGGPSLTGMTVTTRYAPNWPEYGTADYFEFYDLSQPLGSEYLGTYWWGTTARALISWCIALEANPTDTVAYYSANPGTADLVDLQADVEVRPGQAAGWTITNPTAGSSYALLASIGSSDLPGLASGNAHLLVDWLGAPLLPAPVVMPGGVYSQMMPAALPPSLFVQAAEYSGALRPSNVTAMSNGLSHSN